MAFYVFKGWSFSELPGTFAPDMIRNCIFDWSGTLVDDLPAVWKASNYVLRLASVPELSLDQFRAEFCLPFKHFYDRLVPHVELAELEAWYHAHFSNLQEPIHPLPHARDFLEFSERQGLRSFLLSSIHRDHFAQQIRDTGLARFFERAYVQAMDKRLTVIRVLEENGLNPEETLFIGDMQHDIDAARAGGIHSCAVLTGYNRLEQLRASEPDLVVEHLGELQKILSRTQLRPFLGRESDHYPIPTVGALIENRDGKFLMIRTHKWSDLWGIPGGKIQWGEHSEAALRREILEETGLQLERVEFVLVQDCIHSKEFYKDAHFVLLNYRGWVERDAPVQLNGEAQEYRWVTGEEALKLPLNQPTRFLLEAVLELSRGAACP